MIVHEIGHIVQWFWINIFSPFIVVVSDIGHVLIVEDSVSDPEKERVVKCTTDWSDVTANVPHGAVENLTDSVNSWSLSELTPEPFGHLWNCIDSQAVDLVFLDQVMDPAQKSGSNVVVFLLQVGEICQAAVFYSVLVVVGKVGVWNGTEIVVMLGLIERIVNTVVFIKISHVISDNIDHDPDVPGMTGIDEILEILLRSEVVVQLVQVPTPVPMISTVSVINNWRYPDSIKPHTLNIVQIVDNTSVTTATVVTQILTIVLLTIISCESVSQELIDCSLSPLLRGTSQDALD